MESVNEKSTAYLTITFLDEDDNPQQPSSATYKIHDKDSGDEIRASTALSPTAGVATVTLDKDDNTLVDSTKAKEVRIVTVNAVYGGVDELNEEYAYQVINLDHVT